MAESQKNYFDFNNIDEVRMTFSIEGTTNTTEHENQRKIEELEARINRLEEHLPFFSGMNSNKMGYSITKKTKSIPASRLETYREYEASTESDNSTSDSMGTICARLAHNNLRSLAMAEEMMAQQQRSNNQNQREATQLDQIIDEMLITQSTAAKMGQDGSKTFSHIENDDQDEDTQSVADVEVLISPTVNLQEIISPALPHSPDLMPEPIGPALFKTVDVPTPVTVTMPQLELLLDDQVFTTEPLQGQSVYDLQLEPRQTESLYEMQIEPVKTQSFYDMQAATPKPNDADESLPIETGVIEPNADNIDQTSIASHSTESTASCCNAKPKIRAIELKAIKRKPQCSPDTLHTVAIVISPDDPNTNADMQQIMANSVDEIEPGRYYNFKARKMAYD